AIIAGVATTGVDARGIRAGARVLDIAAGAGHPAIPAAQAGAQMGHSDLTPQRLTAGKRRPGEPRGPLAGRQADAEALPFADAEFDTVMSTVGIMFAPHHEASANELLRVLRPGGKIGLINWTPEGFIGQMFATMKPYAPPPPPGATPPPRWGDEEHVRGLFGDRVSDLRMERRTVRMKRHTDPLEFREYWKRNYGPTIAVYRFNADRPDRVAALDRDFLELLTSTSTGAGWDAEYLLVTARKR